MHGVHRHTGSFEAPRELVGEQHVGELGLVVRSLSAVAPLALQVVEVDPAHGLRARGDVHDPRRRARDEQVQEEPRQLEVGEVVEGERELDPVFGGVPVGIEVAGAVHEDVQGAEPASHVLRERPDRRLRRQVGLEQLDTIVLTRGPKLIEGRSCPSPRSSPRGRPGSPSKRAPWPWPFRCRRWPRSPDRPCLPTVGPGSRVRSSPWSRELDHHLAGPAPAGGPNGRDSTSSSRSWRGHRRDTSSSIAPGGVSSSLGPDARPGVTRVNPPQTQVSAWRGSSRGSRTTTAVSCGRRAA